MNTVCVRKHSFWIFFLFIVVIRFLNLKWIELDNSFFSKIIKLIKNISFYKFIIIAFTINIIYVLFISWGQYYVWATANDFTKILVNLPISKEVPIPYLFEISVCKTTFPFDFDILFPSL